VITVHTPATTKVTDPAPQSGCAARDTPQGQGNLMHSNDLCKKNPHLHHPVCIHFPSITATVSFSLRRGQQGSPTALLPIKIRFVTAARPVDGSYYTAARGFCSRGQPHMVRARYVVKL
jgi:hypothetical protein